MSDEPKNGENAFRRVIRDTDKRGYDFGADRSVGAGTVLMLASVAKVEERVSEYVHDES